MGNPLYHRLEGKSAEDALAERIGEMFNLAPIFARTYFEEMRRLFAEHLRLPDKAGTLLLHALAADEPAGKPLKHCRKVLVELRLEAPGDLESFSFAELERRSHHSKRAIERYLKHVTQVARLKRAGHPPDEIRLVTGLSARVVEQYLERLETHKRSWRLKGSSIRKARGPPARPACPGRWLRERLTRKQSSLVG